MNKLICDLCSHECRLQEGSIGFCQARANKDGKIVSLNYGRILSLGLDPIEKKPLANFYPGSKILSVGTFGCNMDCLFCQNHEISKASFSDFMSLYMSPEDLLARALKEKENGNIGIAFTYNEPLIGYEYVLDTARLAKDQGLKNVVITNGQLKEKHLKELLPYIDGWNIDLKAFNRETYKSLAGDLDLALNTIRLANETSHVEVTTLIVPKISDNIEEFKDQVGFLASLNPNMPLHLSRYFPSYLYKEPPTDLDLMKKFKNIALEKLKYVYLGNV